MIREANRRMNPRLAFLALAFSILSGCATLPPGSGAPKSVSLAIADPQATALGQKVERSARQHPGYSGFRMLSAGVDGFLARVQMANAAERTLDLQYYHSSRRRDRQAAGRRGAARSRPRRARARADRRCGHGRRRRDRSSRWTRIRISRSGYSIRSCIAAMPSCVRAMEFLVHVPRGSTTACTTSCLSSTTSIALIGGRNIGDQYFQVDPGIPVWRRRRVCRRARSSRSFRRHSTTYWNSAIAIPARALALARRAGDALDEYRRP